jgi:hypothetical protein
MKNVKTLLAGVATACTDRSSLGVSADRNLECRRYDLSAVPNNRKESARKS